MGGVRREWAWPDGRRSCGGGGGSPTLLPHVHVVDLPVPVLGLADAAVGQRVAGVVGVHAKVEVMAGVSHGELGGGRGGREERTPLNQDDYIQQRRFNLIVFVN